MGDCSNSNPVLNNVTALRGAKFIHRIKISVLWFGENILKGHEKQLAVPAKEVREISLLALNSSYNLSAPIMGGFGALVFWFFTLWLLWVWGGPLKPSSCERSRAGSGCIQRLSQALTQLRAPKTPARLGWPPQSVAAGLAQHLGRMQPLLHCRT